MNEFVAYEKTTTSIKKTLPIICTVHRLPILITSWENGIFQPIFLFSWQTFIIPALIIYWDKPMKSNPTPENNNHNYNKSDLPLQAAFCVSLYNKLLNPSERPALLRHLRLSSFSFLPFLPLLLPQLLPWHVHCLPLQ